MRGKRILLPILLIATAGLFGGGAWLLLHDSRPPAATTPAKDSEAPPVTGTALRTSAEDRARMEWQNANALIEKSRRTGIVPSAPVRRAGESEEFFEERKRAVAAYEHFLRDGHVTAVEDMALRRLFVDAQESWQQALRAAGRKQPAAQGAEMADPVLSPMFTTINEEFLRGARAALSEMQGAMFQSEVPTVLGYIRTQAFETR